MLIISTEDARPGMTLAAPVANPDAPERELLRRGYVLEETVLTRLRSRGIATLYVAYPALDFLDKHLSAELGPERQQLALQLKKSFADSEKHSAASVSYKSYYSGVRDLVTALIDQGSNPFYLDQMSRMDQTLVQHSASVAHLSLLLGLRLEQYLIDQRKRLSTQHARDVVNLGVAAMLHDVGKQAAPAAARTLSAANASEDPKLRAEWEAHSRVGYDLVHDSVEPTAASAVLHHHQHFDGTGSPTIVHRDGSKSSLSGERIHVFARIIMVSDLFDRLVHGPGGGARKSNIEAHYHLRTKYAAWCDPTILRVLLTVAPPYPPGSRVKLDDGSEAIVTGMDPAGGYLPMVQRFNGEGFELDSNRIDLKLPGSPTIRSVGDTLVAPFAIAA